MAAATQSPFFSFLLAMAATGYCVGGAAADVGGPAADRLASAPPTPPTGCAVAHLLHPPPRAFEPLGGCAVLDDDTWAIGTSPQGSPTLHSLASDLADDVAAATGVRLPVIAASDHGPATRAGPQRRLLTLRLLDGEGAAHRGHRRADRPRASSGSRLRWRTVDESYSVTATADAVTVTAATDAGLFYGTRTLLQLFRLQANGTAPCTKGKETNGTAVANKSENKSKATATLPACNVVDAPDSPVRAFYLDANPAKQLNQTFFRNLAELMSNEKLNLVILHTAAWFDLATPRVLGELRNVTAILNRRRIRVVPEIGPYTTPETFEGLWVRDEPFVFPATDPDGVAAPINNATGPPVGPSNAGWTDVVGTGASARPVGWNFLHGSVPGQGPCRLDPTTRTPRGGRTIRCDVQVDPTGAHAGGFGSDLFPIDPQGFYFVRASVRVNTSSGASPPALLMGCRNESSANFGAEIHATGGEWATVMGTFASPVDSACTSDCYGSIETRFVGSGMVTWWLGDLEVMRLNGAMLNVIRTNATDVNVTGTLPNGTRVRYDRGVDFEVLPAKALIDSSPDFLAMGPDHVTRVRRTAGGRIQPGASVNVSYDFGTAFVGDCTKINHPAAMAEPEHYAETKAAVDSVQLHFPNVPAVFFSESDEVRGMNRDSRSARLGLSNADLLATDMNRLARMVTDNNPAVMPMFWADMVCALHNGDTAGYQRTFGGRSGATAAALPQLNRSVGLVPWWYTDPRLDPKTVPLTRFVQGFYRNYSIAWFGGSGQSAGNNAAWAASINDPGSGGLGIVTTQWQEQPDLTGLAPAGAYSWNHLQRVNCTGQPARLL